uniref:hypothetical protein n=1 Tax=Roseomonas rosulenta TaxID=2748667 RepID=UPI001E5B3924
GAPAAAPPPSPAPEPPAERAPSPLPVAVPAPAPATRWREPASVESAPSSHTVLLRAWVASVVVVAGGMVALVVFRAQVMSAWPPATRLFAALGLA